MCALWNLTFCSYHAHASSSKGSLFARLRKEHNQGIAGCCSFPPKRSVRYIFTSTHLESNLCAPLLLSTGIYVLHLEENDKNERLNLLLHPTAQKALPILLVLLLTLKMQGRRNRSGKSGFRRTTFPQHIFFFICVFSFS